MLEINEIKNYIKERSKDPNFRAKDIEEDYYYSYTYLCNFTKKHTNMTVKELMDKYRFNRVIYQLKNTNLTITEISEKFGLREDAFRKKFKRKYHTSPLQYRKLLREREAVKNQPA